MKMVKKKIVEHIYFNTFMLVFQMQETQQDVSLDRESFADSIRGCELFFCTISLASTVLMFYIIPKSNNTEVWLRKVVRG